MAVVKPFPAYRYSPKAGDPSRLVTQPYDKISPDLQARYLAASPYNLVRIILGERFDSDNESNNVYTRAADYFHDWIRAGILTQDGRPAFYSYSQEFVVPDTGERATRAGFIGLGKLEDYSAGVIYRHERTLSGPKKDRLDLLRHTRAHFGQIFMLYPDPEGAVEKLLQTGQPLMEVRDDYQARHRISAITDPETVGRIEQSMADRRLLIADGHHRYETALAYARENPALPSAEYAMMTFVNMHSPGLKILATHRVLRHLPGFDAASFFRRVAQNWTVTRLESPSSITRNDALHGALQVHDPLRLKIGVIAAGEVYLLGRPRREGELDVPALHHEILRGILGIGEEEVRDEKHITYVRGMGAAAAEVFDQGAQIAFLLQPTPIEDMASIAFSGGVMPQKSTDFYPKLLSGLTIYRL
ncbi:MAG TPA: DUF1015 domain-containing protein [Bryobacteraceae bacterium]